MHAPLPLQTWAITDPPTAYVSGVWLNIALVLCSDQPNCRVQIMMVDGDHRVAIYAAQDIPTGTELLYNYGNRFGKV